jgi:hypothetical protein
MRAPTAKTLAVALAVSATIAGGLVVRELLGTDAREWPWLDTVIWHDEFLGGNIRQEYEVSLVKDGFVGPSSSPAVGGWMEMSAGGTSVARVRLGEEPGSSHHNLLQWSVEKNLRARARIRLNRITNIMVTVGFVGENDPDNVLAAVYRGDQFGWILETINEKRFTNKATGWAHAPDQTFIVEIRANLEGAALYIDGAEVARSNENITRKPLAWEFQLWDVEKEEGGSDAKMYVDYLTISQDR